jgi:hypothetical protein
MNSFRWLIKITLNQLEIHLHNGENFSKSLQQIQVLRAGRFFSEYPLVATIIRASLVFKCWKLHPSSQNNLIIIDKTLLNFLLRNIVVCESDYAKQKN